VDGFLRAHGLSRVPHGSAGIPTIGVGR
jgi:hypothetical protein